jgi:STELLO glycosyltransferases
VSSVSSYLVITSVATADNHVLREYSTQAGKYGRGLIVIGDKKSPLDFELPGCDFYSIERQKNLSCSLPSLLPTNHYSRKNVGYLVAAHSGADIIIETDDDNLPYKEFWQERTLHHNGLTFENAGWVNAYRHFSAANIWPRGFALNCVQQPTPSSIQQTNIACPIQQGLADENPDVDAIYRLTLPLPVKFEAAEAIALGRGAICPFNSQNTTWFKEAFPLLYLPSFCSFRMTDIWRSFVAQRVAWECDWHILFHKSTVWQERNSHNLLKDFQDEIPGYLHNGKIVEVLSLLALRQGKEHILENMKACYSAMIDMALIDPAEMQLLDAWFADLQLCGW